MKVVALAGGTGAARFLRGLCQVVPPGDVTVIGNTGDDVELWGLHISPDLDTVTYTLGGLIDTARGWGVAGDTFQCRDAMSSLGEPTFFALGDRDLAVHVFRTDKLRSGWSLSQITDVLRVRMGVACRILPMSDAPIRTRVLTPSGWLGFQEFFVRERCLPEIVDIAFEGAAKAEPAPGVLEAINAADAVIICPSNPISSVGPILAIEGIRRHLAAARARTVAVSPIVGDAPVSGPAGKMMRATGFEVSVIGVAAAYADVASALVIDHRDAQAGPALLERGLRPVMADSLMKSTDKATELARAAIGAIS
ncbi:MAG TPA: 2-phospho-L-lactate transferase [Polyangiaceae bacterium]|nr:2-phospho-L-lactate transferase [Polyangiaceae bacterium]